MIKRNTLISLSLIPVLTLVLSNLTIAAIRSNARLVVDEAKFGMIYKGSDNKWDFKETDRIPNKVGTAYGWYIHLITNKKQVTWKEEFILPAIAVVWGVQEKYEIQVSNDRKSAIKVKTVTPKNGWISSGWDVAEGDPSGKYVMRIYVEGEFVKEFIFFVE